MLTVPTKIPMSFIHQNPENSSRKNAYCIKEKRSIGKKSIFICSHVDSFTADMGATAYAPVHSNRKCKSVPSATDTVKPANCQMPKLFFILFSPFAFYTIIFGRGSVYSIYVYSIYKCFIRFLNRQTSLLPSARFL